MGNVRKIAVVLSYPCQTGQDRWTDVFKTVEIEIPDDGIDWHVAGEAYNEVIDDKNI